MEQIMQFAESHNLYVIEDTAQAIGAEVMFSDGSIRKAGTIGHMGTTSFFPSKNLGCFGDGGAIFTDDDVLAKAMREIRVHGQSRRYAHTSVGVGGRMDTIQCAIVLAKLERFDWEVEQRSKIGDIYNELLLGKVATVTRRQDRSTVFAQYTVFTENREHVREALKKAGVPTAVHYPTPVNDQPAYRQFCCPECTPISRQRSLSVMSLPMSPYLKESEQITIVNKLLEALAQ